MPKHSHPSAGYTDVLSWMFRNVFSCLLWIDFRGSSCFMHLKISCVSSCFMTLFLEKCEKRKCLLTPNRKPVTNLSDNTTQVQPGEPLDLLGLLAGVLVMGCFKKQHDSWQLHHWRPTSAQTMTQGCNPGAPWRSSGNATGHRLLSSAVLIVSIALVETCDSGKFQGLFETCSYRLESEGASFWYGMFLFRRNCE